MLIRPDTRGALGQMLARIPRLFGSVLLLLGAFAIGSVLHQSFVKGAFGLASPPAVLGLLGGIVLVAVGHRLERLFDPSAYVRGGEDDDETEEAGEMGDVGDDRDPGGGQAEATAVAGDRGPVPSERLEGHEKDESYGRGRHN